MRKILAIIVITIIATIVFVNLRHSDSSQSVNTQENISDYTSLSESEIETESETDSISRKIWIYTIMYANGHSFGYSGDISDWDGWYFDTIHVGDDRMLSYDSIGPSTLRLDLVTRQIAVDLGCADAGERIKGFLDPIDGFKRFYRKYDECIDSTFYDDYGWEKKRGMFSFMADYATANLKNADVLNRCMLDLVCDYDDIEKISKNLVALYNNDKPERNNASTIEVTADDLAKLSDLLKNQTVESWKEEDDYTMGADLAVTVHIANNQFATFGVYYYSRIGSGHGGYTETFHTFDMKNGKELSNTDIFKPQTLDKVKMLLFEVMANHPRYVAWNQGIESASDVQMRFEGTELNGQETGSETPTGREPARRWPR